MGKPAGTAQLCPPSPDSRWGERSECEQTLSWSFCQIKSVRESTGESHICAAATYTISWHKRLSSVSFPQRPLFVLCSGQQQHTQRKEEVLEGPAAQDLSLISRTYVKIMPWCYVLGIPAVGRWRRGWGVPGTLRPDSLALNSRPARDPVSKQTSKTSK